MFEHDFRSSMVIDGCIVANRRYCAKDAPMSPDTNIARNKRMRAFTSKVNALPKAIPAKARRPKNPYHG